MSESQGKFLNSNINGKYKFKRLVWWINLWLMNFLKIVN
jgi:hypothetical protein